MMYALRQAQEGAESRETLVREAWMRQVVRQAQKEGFQRIAIVCGALARPGIGKYQRFSLNRPRPSAD
ncbi:MAG: hypothetical protein IPI11_13570 [Haliscomenobacter sp.]|nr:hypothetical protein [Haliscomenobacter sp.]